MANRIVFILGAGFSKEAGAPLVDEFLATAKNIYANEDHLNKSEKEYFKNVFDYHRNLSQVIARTKFDIDNIEDFFSSIDISMTCAQDKKTIEETRKALIYLIVKTLDVSIKQERYNIYEKFIEDLRSRNTDFSFITFNYDLILERAIRRLRCDHDYCLKPSQNPSEKIKLLKLHGSTNWLLCKKCLDTNVFVLDEKCLNNLYNSGCPNCRSICSPLLIPPTWNKKLEESNIMNVWCSAFEELRKATHIVIIGYSLPETDLYFRHFLAVSLKDNLHLKRLIIVDSKMSMYNRYYDFLNPDFARRSYMFIPKRFVDIHERDLTDETELQALALHRDGRLEDL